ncbi:MAG: extracellular solute-binding protein [Fimbriimonadaceae bacterium]|nr:extracellular solute-binding protein [Fimbriimonadaceae bacterium]
MRDRCAGVLLATLMLSSACAQGPTEIRMMAGPGYGIPPKEATAVTAQIRRAVFEEFHRQHPDVQVVNAGGLNLVGPQADNMFLMSMAGDRAPDVFYVNFRQYYTFVEQGFCRPLDDLVAQNPDVMARVNPTVMDVLKSYDQRVYAVPFFQVAIALYYRKDFYLQVGLDPARPPKTWDEFYDYCRKLTRKDRFGYSFSQIPSYHWQNFLYQAGGEVVEPTESGVWRSKINSSGGVAAIDYFRKLMLPQPDGTGPVAQISTDLTTDINTGKTAMWFGYTNDVVLNQSDLPPSVIGVAALPAGPASRSNEINAGMWAISSRVKDPKKLAACWKFIQFFAGDEAARVNTQKCVELGIGNLVNPLWLEKFGYDDLLAQVDPSYVEANRSLFSTGHPEPYGRNCQQVYEVLNAALDRARLEPDRPAAALLEETQREMDQKLLGYMAPEELARRRGWAVGILASLLLLGGGFGFAAWHRGREARAKAIERLPAGIPRRTIWTFLAICLAPAALSLLTWSYYPLFRGLVIAFQDYKIIGGAQWVGLDNFIGVFAQPVFYQSLANSFLYVGLSLLIGFFIPIFLAIALNEIPRFTVLFRTIFYLPAMTSSLVVALVWRQFYEKTENGLLNALLRPFTEAVVNPALAWFGRPAVPIAHDWLGDPTLAMFAVVLPGIWAGAGSGSILYLAALKNIAPERYEAADIDGANWWRKIRHITLPGIRPLILINLLGVFIAGFKAMENVFVLTQGGPLNSTRTIGLEVWQNAFMFLKFGYATAAAWVMGSILVGFTVIQIQSLLKMRFATARK